MEYSPIVLFVYNRLKHTVETINSLRLNPEAEHSFLYIFSDGPKNNNENAKVNEVRNYVKSIEGFKKVIVIEREKNFGLANNIIEGVTEVISIYGTVIVLEDDLLFSPYFLKYMNESIQLYRNDKKVISIHAYIYPVNQPLPPTFFLIDPGSLGWATWKDRWSEYEPDGRKLLEQLKNKKLEYKFNYDDTYPFLRMLQDQINGKNNSWVIRWYAHAMLNDQVTLYPSRSLVFHNGSDGSGTHAGDSSMLDVELADEPILVERINIEVDQKAREALKEYFKKINPGIVKRVFRKIRKLWARLRNTGKKSSSMT
ncbi:MAG TPA: glycosyltransferase [Flavisolibacter sp.]|jgi:hypothetical protein|nr:glycosyltransferase [Flavisolibacter sp.]